MLKCGNILCAFCLNQIISGAASAADANVVNTACCIQCADCETRRHRHGFICESGISCPCNKSEQIDSIAGDGLESKLVQDCCVVKKKGESDIICEEANRPCLQSADSCLKWDSCENEGLHGRGLKHYKKWWERTVCNISVGGEIITGTPIFTDKNTLRVVNDMYSYFIPLEKIDYIRTDDGLKKD